MALMNQLDEINVEMSYGNIELTQCGNKISLPLEYAYMFIERLRIAVDGFDAEKHHVD